MFDPATGKESFVTKVHGISLNSYTCQKVNFAVPPRPFAPNFTEGNYSIQVNFGVMRRHVRQFVREEEEERTILYLNKIRRTADRQIVTRTE